jgi:hypothetical protein
MNKDRADEVAKKAIWNWVCCNWCPECSSVRKGTMIKEQLIEQIASAIREQVNLERERCIEAVLKSCDNCGGDGYTVGSTTESEHGCDGTEEMCQRTCPIPVEVPYQQPCELCGRILQPAVEAIRGELG